MFNAIHTIKATGPLRLLCDHIIRKGEFYGTVYEMETYDVYVWDDKQYWIWF